MNEKKGLSAGKLSLFIVIGVIVVLLLSGVGTYNSMVGIQEEVSAQSSNIDTQLQRRADLIPNLVNTVKGYAAHETEIMTEIADARSKLAGAQTLPEKATADSELSGALNRLLVVTENYPELKADKQYSELRDELSGTENRIAVARRDYNAAAQEYNKKVRSFPTAIFAGILNFEKVDYFEAPESAQSAPTVDFS